MRGCSDAANNGAPAISQIAAVCILEEMISNGRKRLSVLQCAALLVLALPVMTGLSGCLMAGVTSGGHFFLFPSLGVILLIVVVLLVLRRR